MFSYGHPASVSEGCLISVSRRGAGSGGRETAGVGDATFAPGGPSRIVRACYAAGHLVPLTAGPVWANSGG